MVATNEIQEVNIGFNRMAEQLSKDRAGPRDLMLAGISRPPRTLWRDCVWKRNSASKDAVTELPWPPTQLDTHHRQIPALRAPNSQAVSLNNVMDAAPIRGGRLRRHARDHQHVQTISHGDGR
jgi:two-component system osmolarity sensor histidine kinase EnvZ